ncbi:MAG: T9SS type A sorting domain-containing protein [Saprospiraceae bacterium]|nr:T9SS type A sorting domain-containing protein [Saprospiraceae bacterium]
MFIMEPSMANMDIDFGIAQSPLPVDWLNISAKKVEDHHLISWATAREVNASHYVVERKRNNETNFTALPGEVKAKGYSNKREDYNYADKDVALGGIYVYRVKQVDTDGKYTYSNEVSVVQNAVSSIDIYPNPAKGMTNMNIQLAAETTLDIRIYDNAGALIRSIKSNETMERGSYTETLNISGLTSGVYNVQIDMNGELIQKKLIVVD